MVKESRFLSEIISGLIHHDGLFPKFKPAILVMNYTIDSTKGDHWYGTVLKWSDGFRGRGRFDGEKGLLLPVVVCSAHTMQRLTVEDQRFHWDGKPFDMWGVRMASASQTKKYTHGSRGQADQDAHQDHQAHVDLERGGHEQRSGRGGNQRVGNARSGHDGRDVEEVVLAGAPPHGAGQRYQQVEDRIKEDRDRQHEPASHQRPRGAFLPMQFEKRADDSIRRPAVHQALADHRSQSDDDTNPPTDPLRRHWPRAQPFHSWAPAPGN